MSITAERVIKKLEIDYDEDVPNPRDEEPITKILAFHRRYKLGDVEGYSFEDFDSWDEVEMQLRKDFNIAVMAPLYMYEHGSIGLSTDNSRYPYNCPWDAGQVGYIFITKEDLRKELGIKHITQEHIRKAWDLLDADLKAYNDYLSGTFFYYVLIDHDEVIGGLGGIPADELEEILRKEIPAEYQDLVDEALAKLDI